jgi:hypothetical protein
LVKFRRIGLAIGEADMRFWLILATAVIPFFNSYANAQITVYGVPADLAGDVSMSVVTEGNALKMDAKIAAKLRNVAQTLSAALPQINAKTRCPQHASASVVEVTFLQIQLSSSSFFSPSSGLEVTGDVSSKYCALGISLGRARFSLPLAVALSIQGSRLPKVVISAGQLDLEPYNDFGPLRLALTAPQGKQFVEKKINETVSKKVSDLNKQVQHFAIDLANQQIFQAFDPTIELSRMELQGEDLVIEFSLTGQLNGSAVAAWIENRQPKISVLESRARSHKMAGSKAGV